MGCPHPTVHHPAGREDQFWEPRCRAGKSTEGGSLGNWKPPEPDKPGFRSQLQSLPGSLMPLHWWWEEGEEEQEWGAGVVAVTVGGEGQ